MSKNNRVKVIALAALLAGAAAWYAGTQMPDTPQSPGSPGLAGTYHSFLEPSLGLGFSDDPDAPKSLDADVVRGRLRELRKLDRGPALTVLTLVADGSGVFEAGPEVTYPFRYEFRWQLEADGAVRAQFKTGPEANRSFPLVPIDEDVVALGGTGGETALNWFVFERASAPR